MPCSPLGELYVLGAATRGPSSIVPSGSQRRQVAAPALMTDAGLYSEGLGSPKQNLHCRSLDISILMIELLTFDRGG